MDPRATGPRQRRDYLDWLRGVAVLLMIDAHLFDSWTRLADRDSRAFGIAMIVGGGGTTLFLFLAGVSVALSAGSKFRRSGLASSASRAVALRGLEIFALAFLFRLQAYILGWSHRPMDLLKVDILNVMGPSIAAGALLWRVGSTVLSRWILFAGAAAATAFLTPFVRTFLRGLVPEPIEAYFFPVQGLSNFVFFPWSALVFAGAAVGVLIDAGLTPDADRRVHRWLAAGGAAVAVAAYAASYLPTPFPGSYFWTTSPAYLFLRVGLSTLGVVAAYVWLKTRGGGWSPITQLGRTSLFIYWIHVELLYGLISRPWHGGLPLPEAGVAYVVFCVAMLGCSIAKERVAARFASRGRSSKAGVEASAATAPAPTRSPPSAG
jgi:uncharacterized membrane protein